MQDLFFTFDPGWNASSVLSARMFSMSLRSNTSHVNITSFTSPVKRFWVDWLSETLQGLPRNPLLTCSYQTHWIWAGVNCQITHEHDTAVYLEQKTELTLVMWIFHYISGVTQSGAVGFSLPFICIFLPHFFALAQKLHCSWHARWLCKFFLSRQQNFPAPHHFASYHSGLL